MYEENPPLDEVYDFYTMSEDDFYDEDNLTHYADHLPTVKLYQIPAPDS